jgi:hypothetical protein
MQCEFDILGKVELKKFTLILNVIFTFSFVISMILIILYDNMIFKIICFGTVVILLFQIIFTKQFNPIYQVIGKMIVTEKFIQINSSFYSIDTIERVSFSIEGYKDKFEYNLYGSNYFKNGSNNYLSIWTTNNKSNYRFQIDFENQVENLTYIIKIWKYLGYNVDSGILL